MFGRLSEFLHYLKLEGEAELTTKMLMYLLFSYLLYLDAALSRVGQ